MLEKNKTICIVGCFVAISKSVLFLFSNRNFWDPKNWEDTAVLSMWLALLYLGYQMPHVAHNTHSFTYFFVHVVHKFAITFVMLFVMERFKRYQFNKIILTINVQLCVVSVYKMYYNIAVYMYRQYLPIGRCFLINDPRFLCELTIFPPTI